MNVPRTRCNGEWTEAKFHTFIKNALRDAHRRWKPKYAALNAASIDKGTFLCAGCNTAQPKTFPKGDGDKYRPSNRYADHVEPVEPVEGHVDWNTTIARMFVEVDGYQALCKECHTRKTKAERVLRDHHKRLRKSLPFGGME